MKRWAAGVMAFLLCLSGCGKTQPTPTVPEEKLLPGTLICIRYSQSNPTIAGYDFSIDLTKDEIQSTCFYPGELGGQEPVEKSHITITEKQWEDVQAVIFDLYPNMEEAEASKTDYRNDAFVLDGGDSTDLSLIWDTKDGVVEIGYRWPSDRRVLTLTALLREMADPQGREIIWYESPRLDEIYFTRKHRVNTKRDFSFQLHYTAYDEADPHWELIYYLGKHGAVDKGYIRLEQAHWDAFLAFAEELQLEYFPEATKSDDFFTCQLRYSDEKSKYIVLNDETEEQLKQFFMDLIQQEK